MLSETEIGLITIAILFVGYCIVKAHNNRAINEIDNKLTVDLMETMTVQFTSQIDQLYHNPAKSLLLARRAVGHDPHNFVREELYLSEEGQLFLVGKGSSNYGYKNTYYGEINNINQPRPFEWGEKYFGSECAEAINFMGSIAIHSYEHPSKLRAELWEYLRDCCPVNSENLPIFLCAKAMYNTSLARYIRPEFLEHVKKMEELTGNTGKWQKYGELAKPYVGVPGSEWIEWENAREFMEAF